MKVLVYGQPNHAESLEIPGHAYAQQERTSRAIKRLFAFLGLAVLSILVPVFHFVLVPAFLIIAPFVAYKAYQEEVTLEAAQIVCPECKQSVLFAKNSGVWPLHAACPSCRNRIYFDKSFDHPAQPS
ncbi:MAG: hypothetical protein EOP06_19845 [Proteobacteria bacterium]|nr:MAG: hypothetical protein EOP06_19845 [Pseudomonadota bacterium]